MSDDATEAMLQIKSLDNDASVRLSEWTGEWYVSARVEIGDGVTLHGITEHRPYPGLAVHAFLDACKEVPRDHYLVATTTLHGRRRWRWNGAAFAELYVPEPAS